MAQTMLRSPRILHSLLIVTALLFTAQSHAEQTPWYMVELIVFSQAKGSYAASENWKQDLALPDFNGARVLASSSSASGKSFQTVDSSRYRLQGEWNRLQSSSEYTPLLHTAWLQPGLSRDQAVGVILEAGAPSPVLGGAKPLSGVVKVGLSRYLHLDVNLLYRKPLTTASEDGTSFETFQLSESRRMRSKEIHYLDHPMFGVIALITPLQ